MESKSQSSILCEAVASYTQLVAYKLAYACWILKNQETINEVIENFVESVFTNKWKQNYFSEFKSSLKSNGVCKPECLQIAIPVSTNLLSYDAANIFSRRGFVCNALGNSCFVLDFSFWANQILREKEMQQQRELFRIDMCQELYKPGALGQQAAEVDFIQVCKVESITQL